MRLRPAGLPLQARNAAGQGDAADGGPEQRPPGLVEEEDDAGGGGDGADGRADAGCHAEEEGVERCRGRGRVRWLRYVFSLIANIVVVSRIVKNSFCGRDLGVDVSCSLRF